MVDTPLGSQETHLQSVRPVTRNFLAMSYYVQCTSMTVGYFHGKQKESRLNQENFLTLIFFFSDIQWKLRSELSRKTDLVQCICCQILAFCCWVQTWWSLFTSRSLWHTQKQRFVIYCRKCSVLILRTIVFYPVVEPSFAALKRSFFFLRQHQLLNHFPFLSF